MGKAQLEAQSATSKTFGIAEVALRTKVFKICCVLIALRFQIFFRLIAQFYTLSLILFHFDYNITKCGLSLSNFALFLSKILYLQCVVEFQLQKLGYALTWYENDAP